MRKFITIISALFLLSIIVYAENVEIKEGVQKNDSVTSVSNAPFTPALQNAGLPEIKQIQLEKESNKTQPPKEQQIQSLKPIFPPATQPKVPQNHDNKVSPGNLPAPDEKKSSSDKAPATSTTDAKPMTSAPPNTTTNKTSASNGHISLNFDDADIYSVIQTVFSEILRVNYIIEPKVKGRVTFRSVAPIPKDNVLPVVEVILRLNGVAVIEENSLYRIIPIGDLAREPSAINIGRDAEKVEIKGKALLQVVPVEHVQSSEIVKLITPFVSANAVIVDIPKTNHIIVVDTDANVKRLLQLVTIFDSEQQKNKGPQVFVHHIQNGNAKDIGALLQQIFLGSKSPGQTTASSVSVSTTSPASPSSSATPPRPHLQGMANKGGADILVSDLVKIYADEIMNAIIILGTPEDYEVIKGTIAKLDIVPRQVLIEGTIAQLQLTDKLSLGLAWSLQTNMFNMNPVSISFNPSQLSSDTSKTSGLSLIGIDSGGSVRAVINALASKSKAKLLASPHIMVSDNREARIQVGQQVPLVTSETYGSAGSTSVPIRTIQYKDIGMILKVKPQINDSGLVALQISQEVSTYSKDTLYADETQIILNKTEASTNLVVQDGQTIVIGGLIREDDSKARGGIPLLSRIPILGYLFGNTENEALRTELVILLTPHVVKNQQEAKAITNKFADKVTDEKMNMEVKKSLQVKAGGSEKEVQK
ncbi:MAG: hypothetical protein CVU62_07405 [Deltaproteobacteria bacterium HGW-Deltaproteobacteria-2]|nr:MAG: hypothetical protein CVU62_07405 [Deltaproteobacteria bacterium HGW-Deltaproteobacteria-2]